MNQAEHDFLNDLDKKLWNSADRLRSSLDAAVYKHVVLGLIFLKYASDAFDARREELKRKFRDPNDEYYMDPADYGLTVEDDIERELENRDYYREVNVFWVPQEARWENLRDNSKLAVGDQLPWGKPYRGVGFLLDDALAALGEQNEKLKKVLAKDTFTRHEVRPDTLTGLIDLFSTTNFSATEHNGQPLTLKSKDILGHAYEYFLGEFAQAEGKKGGQYYTPKSIVTLIVSMLRPFRGRVYDPAMGSGGFFVQSEEFLEAHGGKIDALSVYGQESNPTTWRLAAMNMAIRGIDFDFGDGPADSFLNDQHPDLRADFVMANPPFNMKEWGQDKLENDPRWKYGTPPANNANFAWMQHMLHHLAPTGSMALLLANGSMSSNTGGEGEIRKALVEADVVECIVALPGQLFTNTQIPACIWFLTKDKSARINPNRSEPALTRRSRQGEVLFIDARQKGYMKDRVLRDFTAEDIAEIAGTFQRWQSSALDQSEPAPTNSYDDVPGFCKSATLDEVRGHGFVLTPGRYVGVAEGENDVELFHEKMERLTRRLEAEFRDSDQLAREIKSSFATMGWYE
jgi:type I restriction enzyme M protein